MRAALASLIVATWVGGASATAITPDIVGEARSPDGDELLYRELHHCNADGRLCEITYVDPDGETIGVKSLDYTLALPAPMVSMHDIRRGRTMTTPQIIEPGVVVDAGFDNYVRERWDDLRTGDGVTFPFLVLGRNKPLMMRAVNIPNSCDDGMTCLSVTLDAWWLSMLVKPIELAYDSERRLVMFAGVSNIPDERGKGQDVVIRYRYAD
ncbi:hypothetical protein BST95_10385 [Halioglobus japonicus]|uniref:Uncharacterized protein n=1 Tax=Halioglobus japonicus TaxID=930805 RepID=A0AAP8MEY4_9GAMM|nr:hypothetical protein [Halioglobus japonicus]AQA18581.1 hypothetical protein BST95_10385 [Halioglobus japonicus]PLW86605.1 hypothetical protein C0029_09415 [Halioglobus japonicus]GHD12012.1 hypothetical protein GCM10007052_12380 [Halioglobus japonicus]